MCTKSMFRTLLLQNPYLNQSFIYVEKKISDWGEKFQDN